MQLHLIHMNAKPTSQTRLFVAVYGIGGERAVAARRRIRVS
jgi:hypothetical protein